MAGKYEKKNQKKPTDRRKKKLPLGLIVLVIVLTVGIAAAVLLLPRLEQHGKEPDQTRPVPGITEGTKSAEETVPVVQTEGTIPVETYNIYDLGNGLEINQIDSYAGLYMEDGSDEVVSGVLMISLTNHSDQDLQLARIRMSYEDGEALFEVTNLPSGATAVLLEKNRMESPEQEPVASVAENVLFFQKPMDIQEDQILIEGSDGILTVKNVSGEDISGDIFIYYKNYSGDRYYGGITYRATVSGGLKAGESATLMANHYSPDMCIVVMAETLE